MGQTDRKKSLSEAMQNAGGFDEINYSALNKAVKSLQTIDLSALKLTREAFKSQEFSALRKAIKSMQTIDLPALKLTQEVFKPQEVSALHEAVRSMQNIDLSKLNLSREAFKSPEILALHQTIKNFENLNLSSLRETSKPSRPNQPNQPNRKIASIAEQRASDIVTSAKAVGLKVKSSRKSMGMTQKKFADLAGVGRRFISELERGKPTLEFDRVLKVCAAAGIDFFAISRGSR